MERTTGDKLHDQKRHSRLLADGVDHHYIRMIYGRRGAGFSRETAVRLAAARQLRRQNLDGDHTVQSRVKRLEHDPQAAAPQRAEDVTVSNAAENLGIVRGYEKANVESGNIHKVVFFNADGRLTVGYNFPDSGVSMRSVGRVRQTIENASASVALLQVAPDARRRQPIQ